MNVQDRVRGGSVFHDGKAVSGQLARLQDAALASPSFTNNGETTTGSNIYDISVQARHVTSTSSTGSPADLSARAVFGYHLESTAGDVSGQGVVTGSSAGANGIVFPDSTTVFNRGKIITDSNGLARIRLTSTGTTSVVLHIHLPSGLVVTGSTVVFT